MDTSKSLDIGHPLRFDQGTSTLAALALGLHRLAGSSSVLVTPRVTRAKSGAALTLPSPMTSTSDRCRVDQTVKRLRR